MFLTVVRGGNAFAVEQKIKELKKKYLGLSRWKKHGSGKRPYEIIKKSTDNMNSVPTLKYVISPEEVERKLLSSESIRNGLT